MLYKIYNHIVDYLLPKRCLSCAELIEGDQGFCASCWKSFNFISQPYCTSCGRMFQLGIEFEQICLGCIKNPPEYDLARSLFKFDEVSKKIIHAFKYYDKTILASYFVKMLVTKYKDDLSENDLIVPVPMHKFKRLFRIYNQASILAIALSQKLGVKTQQNLLIKKKWTKPQTLLPRLSRLKNIQGSITFNDKFNVKGKKIILVDDVMTTGATIKACAKILKKAGASKVTVLTIATT